MSKIISVKRVDKEGKPIYDKIIGGKPETILCKNCPHEIRKDGDYWYHNAKCYVDGCECQNPEPSQEKHGFSVTKARIFNREVFDDILNEEKEDGKIQTDEEIIQILAKPEQPKEIIKAGDKRLEDFPEGRLLKQRLDEAEWQARNRLIAIIILLGGTLIFFIYLIFRFLR